MPVPQRIRDSAAEAEQALIDLTNTAAPAAADPAPAPSDGAEPPRVDHGATVIPMPTAPTTAPSNEELARRLTEAEQRNASLQGMFNRAEAHNSELAQQIDTLRQLVETLSKQRTTPEPEPAKTLLTPKDSEEFGEDMIDLIRRAAREELAAAQSKISELEGTVAHLRGQLDQVGATTQRTSQRTWQQQVYTAVPDFDRKNVDPKFLAWLDEADELSGYKRGQLLSAAAQVQDIARVKKIFDAFFGPQSSEAPSGADDRNVGLVDPATLVAPGEAAAPQQPTNPAKGKVWTMNEIDALYVKRRRGQISNTEFAKAEADLQRAVGEGRIKTN